MTAKPSRPTAVLFETRAGRESARRQWSMMIATIITALLMVIISMPSRAQEANTIESVTSALQGSTTFLRIAMKQPPGGSPVGFSVANPPRIALDFANTDYRSSQNTLELTQGDVRNVAIVQASNRSRIVLNLKRPMTYTTEIEGNAIIVKLDPVIAAQQQSNTNIRPPTALRRPIRRCRMRFAISISAVAKKVKEEWLLNCRTARLVWTFGSKAKRLSSISRARSCRTIFAVASTLRILVHPSKCSRISARGQRPSGDRAARTLGT